MGGEDWLSKLKEEFILSLDNLELPDDNIDVFRFASLEDFSYDSLNVVRPDGSSKNADEANSTNLSKLNGLLDQFFTVFIKDGLCEIPSDLLSSVTIRSLQKTGERLAVEIGDISTTSKDAFGSLHNSFFSDALVISIAENVKIERPIAIVNIVSANESLTCPRVVIKVGKFSNAKVIVVHLSNEVKGLTLPVVDIDLFEGSKLNYCEAQLLENSLDSVSYSQVFCQKETKFEGVLLSLGAKHSRQRFDINLDGDYSFARLMAISKGVGKQFKDLRTKQDHLGPGSESSMVSSTVVSDDAESVTTGLIKMRKGAVKSRANQINRNLLLSKNSKAESIPNLDIEENDVRCDHASSVGPVDPLQRHYLESRGVKPDKAVELIERGFELSVLDVAEENEIKETAMKLLETFRSDVYV